MTNPGGPGRYNVPYNSNAAAVVTCYTFVSLRRRPNESAISTGRPMAIYIYIYNTYTYMT